MQRIRNGGVEGRRERPAQEEGKETENGGDEAEKVHAEVNLVQDKKEGWKKGK